MVRCSAGRKPCSARQVLGSRRRLLSSRPCRLRSCACMDSTACLRLCTSSRSGFRSRIWTVPVPRMRRAFRAVREGLYHDKLSVIVEPSSSGGTWNMVPQTVVSGGGMWLCMADSWSSQADASKATILLHRFSASPCLPSSGILALRTSNGSFMNAVNLSVLSVSSKPGSHCSL